MHPWNFAQDSGLKLKGAAISYIFYSECRWLKEKGGKQKNLNRSISDYIFLPWSELWPFSQPGSIHLGIAYTFYNKCKNEKNRFFSD